MVHRAPKVNRVQFPASIVTFLSTSSLPPPFVSGNKKLTFSEGPVRSL